MNFLTDAFYVITENVTLNAKNSNLPTASINVHMLYIYCHCVKHKYILSVNAPV